MAAYRKTTTPSLYVRHQKGCPRENADADGRCRCAPSYRAIRRNTITGKPEWSPSSKEKAEPLTWLVAGAKGTEAVRAAVAEVSFEMLARQWMTGVESGAIGKRRGRSGAGYSDTTLAGYRRSLENFLLPEFGQFPAAEVSELEWQMWADRLSREGLSRSRIANHIAVASAVYGWASRATRRLVPRNPLLAVELPPNDEKPRMRVADGAEAKALLALLREDDAVPYAIAFYSGLRRAEIWRLTWDDVDLDGQKITVRKAKSEAGTMRPVPIAGPLKPVLLRARMRAGRPKDGPVSPVSVMSGKLAERATKAWGKVGAERITLHECRHTYASFLMASGYTLKEIMEYMGHADLAMVQRYVKLLPQPSETNAAEKLNRFLGA